VLILPFLTTIDKAGLGVRAYHGRRVASAAAVVVRAVPWLLFINFHSDFVA
jgi:hypothetical protein